MAVIEWTVPREWAGETAYVIGGGPSLRGWNAEVLRGRGRVIAINSAWRIAPWADVLYFADGRSRWFGWNLVALQAGGFAGGRIVTRSNDLGDVGALTIHRLRHARGAAISRDPRALAGYCSGANAVNLAYLFGADPIVLLGFDMRPNGHWHAEHKRPSKPDKYAKHFIPAFERMAQALHDTEAQALHDTEARVWNATPGSALTCFPAVDPAAILGEW